MCNVHCLKRDKEVDLHHANPGSIHDRTSVCVTSSCYELFHCIDSVLICTGIIFSPKSPGMSNIKVYCICLCRIIRNTPQSFAIHDWLIYSPFISCFVCRIAPDEHTLYVKRLPKTMNSESLINLFSPYGEVISHKILENDGSFPTNRA